VILGCCDAAIGFLTKVGSIGRVRFSDSIRMLASGGRELRITASKLPSPVHLLPSLALSGYLSLRQKSALMRVLAAMPRREPSPSGCSVTEYLESLSCPRDVADLVFRPIAVAVLNEDPELASAKYARMAVLRGMLGARTGFRLGTPEAPLSEIIAGPAERYLTSRGAEIRVSCAVERVNTARGGCAPSALGDAVESLTLRGGENVTADAFVVAVPPYSMEDIGLPTDASAILWRPMLSAHLLFEGETTGSSLAQAQPKRSRGCAPSGLRPVRAAPRLGSACVVDEPFGWVFARSERSGDGRVYLQAVASAAGMIVGLDRGELTELALRAVQRAEPEARGWKLLRSVICRHARATFSTAAGCDELRPSERTPLQNLLLAGDWTATGWPSTLEGAVRSGQTAARAVLDHLAAG
jgi:zeta-carotene desaturase